MIDNQKLIEVLKTVNGYSKAEFDKILNKNNGSKSLTIMDYTDALFKNRVLDNILTLDKLKNDYNNNIMELRKDFQLLGITYIGEEMMSDIVNRIKRNKWTMEMIYNKYKNGYQGNIMSLVSCRSELLSV